jgi:peptidoglycan hydrolase CwlO-like protein
MKINLFRQLADRTKKIIALLLAIFLFPTFALAQDSWQQYQDATNQASNAQSGLSQTEQQINSLNNVINSLNNAEANLANQITDIQNQIDQKQVDIVNLTAQIDQKQKELDKEKQTLNNSLVFLYETGDTPVIEIFLSSKSISSALDQMEYISWVEKQIEDTVNKINQAKKEIEANKVQVEKEKKDLETQQQSLNGKLASLDIQKQIKNESMAELANVKQGQLQQVTYFSAQAEQAYATWVSQQTRSTSCVDCAASSWYFSQLDYPDPIHSYGCAATSLAMVYKYYGVNATPPDIWGQFTTGNMLSWGSAQNYNSSGIYLTVHEQDSANWGVVNQKINENHPVIVRVSVPGGSWHYVVVYKQNSDGTHLMSDPVFGPGLIFEQHYGQNIYQMEVYQP